MENESFFLIYIDNNILIKSCLKVTYLHFRHHLIYIYYVMIPCMYIIMYPKDINFRTYRVVEECKFVDIVCSFRNVYKKIRTQSYVQEAMMHIIFFWAIVRFEIKAFPLLFYTGFIIKVLRISFTNLFICIKLIMWKNWYYFGI